MERGWVLGAFTKENRPGGRIPQSETLLLGVVCALEIFDYATVQLFCIQDLTLLKIPFDRFDSPFKFYVSLGSDIRRARVSIQVHPVRSMEITHELPQPRTNAVKIRTLGVSKLRTPNGPLPAQQGPMPTYSTAQDPKSQERTHPDHNAEAAG